jgi:ABC-type transporter Mla MlaB component
MRGIREARNFHTSRSSRVRQFSLTSFREAQRMVVRACGRLIVGQGADQDLWAAHVDEATGTNVALDLSCVNDVDARGLGLLAGLVNRARGRGTIVSVMAASRVVQRLGEMTRLDRALPGAWHERSGVLGCHVAGKRSTTRCFSGDSGGGCHERSATA